MLTDLGISTLRDEAKARLAEAPDDTWAWTCVSLCDQLESTRAAIRKHRDSGPYLEIQLACDHELWATIEEKQPCQS